MNDETLFVNRKHSGQGTTADQLIAISPVREDEGEGHGHGHGHGHDD